MDDENGNTIEGVRTSWLLWNDFILIIMVPFGIIDSYAKINEWVLLKSFRRKRSLLHHPQPLNWFKRTTWNITTTLSHLINDFQFPQERMNWKQMSIIASFKLAATNDLPLMSFRFVFTLKRDWCNLTLQGRYTGDRFLQKPAIIQPCTCYFNVGSFWKLA